MGNDYRGHAAFAWLLGAMINTFTALVAEPPFNIIAAVFAAGGYYMWRKVENS